MILWLSKVKVDGHLKYSVPQVNWLPAGIGATVSKRDACHSGIDTDCASTHRFQASSGEFF